MQKFNPKNYFKTNKLVLAPMAGYTDIGFRHLCRKYGAGLVFTEMISVKALLHDSQKTLKLMEMEEDEHPIAIQLFGNDPADFEQVIKLDALKVFDVIDINMGCPAPKIVKNGDGSSLLRDIEKARQIIETTVKNTDKPVSVKFRSGLDSNNIVAQEFAKMCEDAGASFITIHPRTVEQGYSGKADYEIAKKVIDAVSIPVIVSGDVLTNFDLNYLTGECGASAVMIGRGALGRPEIFSEIMQDKKAKLPFKEKIGQIEEHVRYLLKIYDEKYVSLEMKKHILNYVKQESNSVELKLAIVKYDDIYEMIEFLKHYI